MTKPTKVPGTKDTTNREQRRAAERGKDSTAEATEQQQQHQRGVVEEGTPPDVTDTRAKNQRHGKVTADKWNQ
jgi:hypothetical protein